MPAMLPPDYHGGRNDGSVFDELFAKEQPTEVIHDVGNGFHAGGEGGSNLSPVTKEASVFEVYHRGGIQFHVHFTWSFNCSGEPEANQFCAIFQRLPARFGKGMIQTFASRYCDAKA